MLIRNQPTTTKWDIGLLIAFPEFLCRILDPMNPNSNLLTMQDVSNFHNKVVLGLEQDEVSYVGLRYRALHVNRGLVGSTRKVRVLQAQSR